MNSQGDNRTDVGRTDRNRLRAGRFDGAGCGDGTDITIRRSDGNRSQWFG